ncbi:MAG: copper-containing nitrite reductase [Ignavibacteriaceae bacterium]
MKKLKNIKIIAAAAVVVVLTTVSIIFMQGCDETYSNTIEGTEFARLTHAPFVPPAVARDYPTKVIVNLETTEEIKRLADGVEYTFWTFGGEVPGKFIRVREGDLVEFNLSNSPDSKMPHNIDLHAVTGPGGGAEASFTAPGHTSTFSFLAINPGLYVYHCATAPVGLHIANGMYGLILVEPKEGLPPVDKEFYIMQSEFYTAGKHGESGLQEFSQDKAVDEEPEYVVFNGSVGALTGDKKLQAKKGETIRLYLGNGGPNLVSSFHVIGEIFDRVYGEGGVIVNQKNVQTTLIPAGGSSIVEFTVDVPGTFILVDHSIFRAFHKGAIGMLNVVGEDDSLIYSHKIKDEIYLGVDNKDMKSKLTTAASPDENSSPGASGDLKAMGKGVYTTTCQPCHQANGEGIAGVFPPLAKSDFLNNKEKSIRAVINGLSGPLTVNGKTYNGVMPPQNINDEQVAAVLTYVYSQWGNSGKTVTKDEVAKQREKKTVAAK